MMVNYDIHGIRAHRAAPGRVDRIGSTNQRIQLVNTGPTWTSTSTFVSRTVWRPMHKTVMTSTGDDDHQRMSTATLPPREAAQTDADRDPTGGCEGSIKHLRPRPQQFRMDTVEYKKNPDISTCPPASTPSAGTDRHPVLVKT